MEKPLRKCPSCHREEPVVSFYKKSDDCRSCIHARTIAEHGHPREHASAPLADKVEKHRQEKILRDELKKIAKRRFEKRVEARRMRTERGKREARVKEFIPQVTAEVVEVTSAVKELAARVLQRRSLVEFVKCFHPKYKAGWVHHDICRKLEQFSRDVAAGLSPRLMILMPPRHGKSQIASKLFPAWHLGHYPDHEIIACSYNVSLALDFSREVRSVVDSDRYRVLFDKAQLDPDVKAAESWKLLSQTGIAAGGYVAAGIGGPINGKGAHVLIIDDPIKNAEEANSVDHLRKIKEWFDSTAYTRLAPGGGVLLIQTWWSDMDLAGQLQDEMKEERAEDDDFAEEKGAGDQYEVIKYPAIAVEDEEFRLKGEALHPERFDMKALERIKRKLGGDKGRYWNALYQQNPIPDEGAFFTRSMFKYRDERPNLAICHIYQAWDFAIGEKRYNDWTVGVTIAVDPEDNMHVIELQRMRTADMARISDEILNMYERYPRVQAIGVEDGQIWRGVKTHLSKRTLERRAYPNIQELKPLTDKQVRARPLQGRMQQNKVTFPRQADWLPVVLKEFLRFPVGMHDDTVDTLAWAAEMILGKAPPRKPVFQSPNREKTVAEKLRALAFGTRNTSHMAS